MFKIHLTMRADHWQKNWATCCYRFKITIQPFPQITCIGQTKSWKDSWNVNWCQFLLYNILLNAFLWNLIFISHLADHKHQNKLLLLYLIQLFHYSVYNNSLHYVDLALDSCTIRLYYTNSCIYVVQWLYTVCILFTLGASRKRRMYLHSDVYDNKLA